MFVILAIVGVVFVNTPRQVYAITDLCQIFGVCGDSYNSNLDPNTGSGENVTTPVGNNGNNGNNNGGTSSGGLSVTNTVGFSNLADIINRLSVFIIPIAVIGFIACVIYSGYIRLFSAGDSNAEKKSMIVAKSAAIGFAIIFFANISLLLLSNILKLSAV